MKTKRSKELDTPAIKDEAETGILSEWEKSSSDKPSYDSTPIQSKRSKSTDVVSFDDLPDLLSVEILCRLPSKELVFQCKCVSKHWLNLISDPYFIGRFLHLQRFHKQTRIARTLIDRRGEEFPPTTEWSSPSNLLTPLFKRLMSFHRLKENPYVVATSNDLVLCCRTPFNKNQRDFYICNPCTRQWIALPPTTRRCKYAPVGFICDLYYEEEDGSVGIKKEYRCMVVRILPHDLATTSLKWGEHCKFIVEVFSFETGEWRESIVSSPRSIRFADATRSTSVAHNGMLYWTYVAYEPRYEIGVIALDPFVIGINGSRNGGETTVDHYDHYQFRLSVGMDSSGDASGLMCVRQGRLHMLTYSCWKAEFMVWELTDDLGSADGFYLRRVSVHPRRLEVCLYHDHHRVVLLTLDPNDVDIFYVKERTGNYVRRYDTDVSYEYHFKIDVGTRTCSRVGKAKYFEHSHFYPLVLPWWPTPLRRLPICAS
ncbi:hypothetical protein ACLB2K_030509 [Fragaria x ananassa]